MQANVLMRQAYRYARALERFLEDRGLDAKPTVLLARETKAMGYGRNCPAVLLDVGGLYLRSDYVFAGGETVRLEPYGYEKTPGIVAISLGNSIVVFELS